MKKHALTGISLALHKNKQKNPFRLLIVWCVSITNSLSNHKCRFGRKAFGSVGPGTSFGHILKRKPSPKIAQL